MAPSETQDLQSCGQADDLCAQISGDAELSRELQQCSHRIGDLCAKLQAADAGAAAPVPPPPPARHHEEEEGGEPCGPAAAGGGILIVRRPEEARGVAQAREEKTVAAAISEHARFDLLDDLERTVVASPGFEELREAFPRHHRHHPSLFALTDHTLSEKALFTRTVWGSLSQEPEPLLETQRRLTQSATQARLRLPPPKLDSTSDALPHREHPVKRPRKKFPHRDLSALH